MSPPPASFRPHGIPFALDTGMNVSLFSMAAILMAAFIPLSALLLVPVKVVVSVSTARKTSR